MITTYEIYRKEKDAFFNANAKYDWKCETSSMDEYGRYVKTYIFTNEAMWYEVMTPVTETVTFEHRGIKFEREVQMQSIEYWNTKNAESKTYYEKW